MWAAKLGIRVESPPRPEPRSACERLTSVVERHARVLDVLTGGVPVASSATYSTDSRRTLPAQATAEGATRAGKRGRTTGHMRWAMGKVNRYRLSTPSSTITV